MHITDNEGSEKEITNLRKAIQEARLFKDMKHIGPGFEEFDKRQNAYWTVIYEKLLQVKKMIESNSRKRD